MKLINSLKTVCDFLLLISFAALIPSYGEARLLIALVLVLSFVSSLLVQSIPDIMPLRLLCALLPALGLLASKSLAVTVITAIIISFYVLIVVEEKIEMHYDDYKFWFAIPAVPIIVLFVVTASYWPIRSTSTVCAGLYLFLGVLVLRRKRIGSRATAGIKLINLAEMAGVFVFDAIACFIIHTIVMVVKDYLVLLMTPLAMIFHFPAYVISILTDKLYLWMRPSYYHQDEKTKANEEAWASSSNPGAVPMFKGKTGDEWAYMIISVALVITLVVLVWWILYAFWKMLHSVDTETAGKEAIEGGKQEPFRIRLNRRRKRKRGFASTNNEKVRMIYADYLFFMKACGVNIRRQSTSEEVLAESIEFVEPEKARELRELYLRARYNDADELSEEDVHKAQELYNYITANATKE